MSAFTLGLVSGAAVVEGAVGGEDGVDNDDAVDEDARAVVVVVGVVVVAVAGVSVGLLLRPSECICSVIWRARRRPCW